MSMNAARALRILGVSKQTPLAEVKKKYRALVSIHHPDAGGDERYFQDLTGAFDVVRELHTSGRIKDFDAYSTLYNKVNPAEGTTESDRFNNRQATQSNTAHAVPTFSVREFLWMSDVWEYLLALSALAITGFCMAYMFAYVQVFGKESARSLLSNGAPTTMTQRVYEENARNEKQQQDQLEHRRNNQTTFRDLREYLYLHDTEHFSKRVLMRSLGTVSNVKDACDIDIAWKDIQHSGADERQVEKNLVEVIDQWKWDPSLDQHQSDISRILRLVAVGSLHIPSHHLVNFNASEVHYMDAKKRIPARCVLRVRNEEVATTNKSRQKILVSGGFES